MAAQLAEQLLQIGQRNLLARADGGQGHGARVLAQREVDHRGDGKTAFGGQTHKNSLASGTTGQINRRSMGCPLDK
jgi:hypothetical protein